MLTPQSQGDDDVITFNVHQVFIWRLPTMAHVDLLNFKDVRDLYIGIGTEHLPC